MTVPTVAMRNGDFSGLINSAGILQQLYDPATTQTAAQNYARARRSPITRFRSTASARWPRRSMRRRPFRRAADNPLINSNFNDTNNITQTVPNITFRLDHVFNENNRVYFRFTDIDQQQQALRNYPANSPANIEGGGLPAGATGFQRSRSRPSAAPSGSRTSSRRRSFRRNDLQHAVAANVCRGQ